KIAQNMGFALGSVQRIQAGISFSLKQESGNGHVYQEIETLKEKTFQLLEIEPVEHKDQMKSALRNLHEQDKIKLITYQEKHFIGLSALYGSEKGIAQKVSQLLATPITHGLKPKEIYDSLQKSMDMQLNEDQQN